MPKSSAASCFVYAVLPLQQLLAAYFFLTAWQGGVPENPGLVGAGSPLKVFQISSLVAVGLYLFAVTAQFALSADEKEVIIPYMEV